MKKLKIKFKNMRINGNQVRASYTVEASFIVPIILLCLFMVMHISIGLCRNVQQTAQDYEQVEEIDAVSLFRNTDWADEWIQSLFGE